MRYSPSPQVNTPFLNELVRLMSNGPPAELVLRRYERQAEQLFHTDRPEWGWVAHAAVAALAWDASTALEMCSKGAQAVGSNPEVLANFAVSLKHLNEFEAALQYARQATEASPVNGFALRHHVGALLQLGRWSDALAMAERYVGRVGNEQAQNIPEIVDMFRSWMSCLGDGGVSERQVQLELAQCWAVLRENRIRCGQLLVSCDENPEGGAPTMVLRLTFVGEIEDEMRLGALLAQRLSRLESWDPTRLSVDFEYVEQFEHEDADATV